MNGRIPDLPAPAAPNVAASGRSLLAALIALAAGAVALVSPPMALLGLAALGAAALMRAEAVRIDPATFAGPAFVALIVGAFAGLAAAIGVLFAWRLFADAHWSAAHAARLAAAAGRPAETRWRAQAHVWLTPAYGLTLVAFTAPHMIAGLPLDLPHAPVWVPMAAGTLAACAFFDWGLRRAADWRLGELAAAPAAHLFAHHGVFLVAFGLGLDVSAGIVVVLAWRLAHAALARTSQVSFTAVP
jgi:hypothetical protein